MRYKVNNMQPGCKDYKYVIIRDCGSEGYWYYGATNDLARAQIIAKEIGNGIVVELKNVML